MARQAGILSTSECLCDGRTKKKKTTTKQEQIGKRKVVGCIVCYDIGTIHYIHT